MKKMIMVGGRMANAVRWDGVNLAQIREIAGDKLMEPHLCMGFLYLFIATEEGISQCNEGDWVAKDVDGKLHVLKAEEMQ
ncbi:MAG: hypothetical protein IK041_06670 [Bacteroidales bacterium]|nr:hypothetical protein [Bacteroidales bacterium]